MKLIIIALSLIIPLQANASDLVFSFNSPAFSGNGYSTHVLTIEQLEQQRKEKEETEAQAALDEVERELRSTNEYKFKNNLESRIYATLSSKISASLFGEDNTISIGEWNEVETPFGDVIKWVRDVDDRIYVEIYDSNGDMVSSFDVPVGEFAF